MLVPGVAWQIALQLVRQDATVEPQDPEVNYDKSDQNTAANRTSELLKNSNHEQIDETSKEFCEEKPDITADHSQSLDNQSTDKEVL